MADSHDGRKTLSDLRDHLARHDKPIAFFFGAGTSSSISVPSVAAPLISEPIVPAVMALTAICKADASALGVKFGDAWKRVEDDLAVIGLAPQVENILSRLRMMLGAVAGPDKLVGLDKPELEQLEESVRRTIARAVAPDLKRLPVDFPHRGFARWLSKTARKVPVELFTVNYDVLFEHALEIERVPVFDGFVGTYRPYFHPDTLRRQDTAPGATWARLWKMHGSVTWRREEVLGRKRVVRGDTNDLGEMIFPSFEKYDESRQQPYSAYADRLTRFLDQEDAMLIMLGYSFGDEHINNIIFGALENRSRTHAYAIQFLEIDANSDLAKRSLQRPNMIVVGPETGCIGGRRASWDASDATASPDGAFEVKGAPAKFSMKIGDFNVFCNFLEDMSTT